MSLEFKPTICRGGAWKRWAGVNKKSKSWNDNFVGGGGERATRKWVVSEVSRNEQRGLLFTRGILCFVLFSTGNEPLCLLYAFLGG